MLRQLYSQIYKQITSLKSWPGEIATYTVYPLIGLLTLGLLGTFVIKGGIYSEAFIFIIYGVLSWNAYSVSQHAFTRGFILELWSGSLKNLFITKLGIKNFLFGNMIFAVMGSIFVFTLFGAII